ncbi:MAG: hypothetical protein VR71_10740 [Roseovarius sp. BRH_c41]|nr:MAG: hypothetical protein VR71_10740 [Roseovarius sp. BRH_c41]
MPCELVQIEHSARIPAIFGFSKMGLQDLGAKVLDATDIGHAMHIGFPINIRMHRYSLQMRPKSFRLKLSTCRLGAFGTKLKNSKKRMVLKQSVRPHM